MLKLKQCFLSVALLMAAMLFYHAASGNTNPGLPTGFPVTDGLSAYFDAEAVEVDDGHVTRWIDRSGNSHDAMDTTPPVPDPTMPVLLEGVTPSGRSAVRFDGVGGYAEIAGNAEDFDGRAKTTVVVFRADVLESGSTAGRITNTAYEIIDDWSSASSQPSTRTVTNAMWAQGGAPADATLRVQNRNPDGGAISVSTPDGTLQAGEFYVGVNQWKANGDTVSILRNGANERFENWAIGAMATPEGHIHTRIGAGTATGSTDLDHFFGGEVAAFLVYNRELPSSELQQVEEYLHEVYLGAGPDENGPGEPPVLDGLVAHFNAANVQTNDDVVTELTDLSGRENHAQTFVEEEPALTRPTLLSVATPSGLDAVSFNGVGGYMEIGSNPESFDGREKTILTVFRSHTLGLPGRFIVSGYNEGAGFPYYMTETMFATTVGGGTLRVSLRQADGLEHFSSPGESVTTGEFYVGGIQIKDNGEASAIVRNAANERFVEQTSGIDADPQGHAFTRLGTGGPSGLPEEVQGDSFFTGELAAVLIYNHALDANELEEVEEYLHQVYLGAGPSEGGPGNPPVTDGLVLHLNSTNVEMEDNVVASMLDVSGNGNHAESHIYEEPRPTPTFVANAAPSGKGVLRFNGDGQFLRIDSSSAGFDGVGKTSIAVFNPESFGLQRIITAAYGSMDTEDSDAPSSTTAHSLYTHTSGALRVQNRDSGGGSVAVSSPGGSVELEKFHIGTNLWQENGDTLSIVVDSNNERFVESTTGAIAKPGAHLRTNIGAGAQDPADNFYAGDLAAVVLFNRELTQDELMQVEQYLYSRYIDGANTGGGYVEWIAGFDIPQDLRGPEADASGDGVVNLVKYALGLNPLEASREGLPTVEVEQVDGDHYLTITVVKDPDADGVALTAEAASDLFEWSSDSSEVVVLEDTASVLRARVAKSVDEAATQFLRVVVDWDNE